MTQASSLREWGLHSEKLKERFPVLSPNEGLLQGFHFHMCGTRD